jgi:hypothetical protein
MPFTQLRFLCLAVTGVAEPLEIDSKVLIGLTGILCGSTLGNYFLGGSLKTGSSYFYSKSFMKSSSSSLLVKSMRVSMHPVLSEGVCRIACGARFFVSSRNEIY